MRSRCRPDCQCPVLLVSVLAAIAYRVCVLACVCACVCVCACAPIIAIVQFVARLACAGGRACVRRARVFVCVCVCVTIVFVCHHRWGRFNMLALLESSSKTHLLDVCFKSASSEAFLRSRLKQNCINLHMRKFLGVPLKFAFSEDLLQSCSNRHYLRPVQSCISAGLLNLAALRACSNLRPA